MPMAEGSRRIHIVGGPGSGKTTLAAALALHLGTAAHHLDDVASGEGTGPDFRPKRAFALRERDAQRLSEGEAWVTEGSYLWWTEPLFQRAQAIIWIDPPWPVAARLILTRHVRSYVADVVRAPGLRDRLRALRYPHLAHLIAFLRWSAHYYRSPAEDHTSDDPDDMRALTGVATERYLERYKEKVVRLVTVDLDAAVRSVALLGRSTVPGRTWSGGSATP